MSKDSSLVKRLIAFLKKPEALDYREGPPVSNPYDDYAASAQAVQPSIQEDPRDTRYPPPDVAQRTFMQSNTSAPLDASRLDALLVRAVQQFHAQIGCVVRQSQDGRMTYCTGRDMQGRYISHVEASLDRRALFLAVDTGESQLFVPSDDVDNPNAVLCGPLWMGDEVIGVLYLDGPARSRLHRGIFDVFCEQAARMLAEGVA